jgi:hypothetical protein
MSDSPRGIRKSEVTNTVELLSRFCSDGLDHSGLSKKRTSVKSHFINPQILLKRFFNPAAAYTEEGGAVSLPLAACRRASLSLSNWISSCLMDHVSEVGVTLAQ